MQGSWDTAGEMTPNVPMEPNGLHGRQLKAKARVQGESIGGYCAPDKYGKRAYYRYQIPVGSTD